MVKKIYYAQQEWQKDHYYLGVTGTGLAFVGSVSQPIEELKNWYPQVQLEASEKKTAPYKEALISYLNQHLTTFAYPIDIEGTPFQKEVWQALQEIPYGEIMTYQEISEKIGRPRAVRTVGTVIGKNLLLMAIPCHQVIGSKGQLTGCRGGLAMKQALLTFKQSQKEAVMNNYQWYTEQWGKPTREDDLLFLLLTVGVFRVGLSWKAAAGKEVALIENFCQVKPEKAAALLPDEADRIVANPDMIRNRHKIEATTKNAQAALRIQEELGSFVNYLWQFVKNVPVLSVYEEAYQVLCIQFLSDNVAKDLKKRGFSFAGPIVTNMFLKASGIIQVEILNPEQRSVGTSESESLSSGE